MHFLVPAFFAAGIAAALGVAVLHLIVFRPPPGAVFPTARFVPDGPVEARALARRPEDLLLLLLRMVLVMLIGAAFAHPYLVSGRKSLLRIVAADRSHSVADLDAVGDSAKHILAPGGVLVMFDSTARAIETGMNDSLTRCGGGSGRGVAGLRPALCPAPTTAGSLSAALVVSLREAARLRDRADSLELVVVSPFAAEEWDAATDSLAALWPGAIRMVRVAARMDSGNAHPKVNWPPDGHAPGTAPRNTIDTIGAVIAHDVVLVAPFERRWRLDTAGARVIARWVDGEPAAVERAAGRDCERDVGIAVPSGGDLQLRPEYERFTAAMARPCGAPPLHGREVLTSIGPTHTPSRVSTREIAAAETIPTPLVPWLLAGAIVLALTELLVRRRSGGRA